MKVETERSDAEMLADIEADRDAPVDEAISAEALRDIAVGVDLRARADADIAAGVARARAAGLSWGVIGAALGVSRQAALKRFGPKA